VKGILVLLGDDFRTVAEPDPRRFVVRFDSEQLTRSIHGAFNEIAEIMIDQLGRNVGLAPTAVRALPDAIGPSGSWAEIQTGHLALDFCRQRHGRSRLAHVAADLARRSCRPSGGNGIRLCRENRRMSQSLDFDPKAPARLRLAICDGLLRWVVDSLETWAAGIEQSGRNLILLAIFARSTRTYSAAVHGLGELAYGEQLMMLDRLLFDDMIDLHWVSLNPELAVERLADHDLYSRLLRADVQRKHLHIFDGQEPPKITVSNEKRKELKALFGKNGSGSWTGIRGLDSRVGSVLTCWDEPGRDMLLFWHDWIVRLQNEIVHPTSLSLTRMGLVEIHGHGEDESAEFKLGSTPAWVPQALHAAFWTYSQSLGLVVDEFHAEAKDDFRERYEAGEQAFSRADHWESVGAYEGLPPEHPDA
jgi:hypothetical protein